jgi:hypothetical protein
MKVDQKKKKGLFSYGEELPFVKTWFFPLIILVSLAVIFSHGFGVLDGPGYFLTINFFKNAGLYTVDPIASTFNSFFPPVQRLFIDIISIPFYHFLIGSLAKISLVALVYLLAWRISHSTLASFIAVLIMFGLAELSFGQYQFLNLRIPIGFTTAEFRAPIYLSFRLVSMIFLIAGTIFFLDRRFFLCSLFLSFGFYSHAISAAAFFLSFFGVLVILLLRKADRLGSFYALLKFVLPFILLTSPYSLSGIQVFSEIEPMDFASFRDLALINEADDFSTVWFVQYFKTIYLICFLLTAISAGLHLIFKTSKPIAIKKLKVEIFNSDLILPLLFIPWMILLLNIIWELTLIPLLPDTLNDIVSMLKLSRITTVSAVIYVPIISVFISRMLLVLIKTIIVETFSEIRIEQLKVFFLGIKIDSKEKFVSITLVLMVLVYTLCFKNKNIATFEKYWNFEHVSYDYFLDSREPVYVPTRMNMGEKVLPLPALLEVCEWVQRNTLKDAAIVGPSYISRVRVYCNRQGFLTEREDGGFAVLSRKFATLYYQRFYDLHKGLTYYDLLEFNGLELYDVLRERYLSLVESDIESLKKKYPGYDYFLTEKSHSLDYPLIFENEFFLFYDISSLKSE